ncbi:adenylate kinase [Candidatus Micrarchaeota archaeon]|nr:adenylate kinase [Candidatus Micrarchaeota archaeon]
MIVVMGAPGAGKTTVLAELRKEFPEVKIIVYGDLMYEIAKRMQLVNNKDEIRKLPQATQKRIQSQVARVLAKEEGKVILDTHCSINTPHGYLPGLPFELLSKFKVERLALIEAPIQQIISRRKKDLTRMRDAQLEEQLEEHAFVNRGMICAYAAFTGAPVRIIKNKDGKLQDAVQELKQLLQ